MLWYVGELYSTFKKRFWSPKESNELGFWNPKGSNALEMTRSNRDFGPADYLLKIESFSAVKKLDKYESDVFEAGGYKWKLCLYPNGNTQSNGKDHISIYLAIQDTDAIRVDNWEVNTDFKLFLFDQINNKFLAVQAGEGTIKRFNEMKTEWGFSQFISLETFNDARNGYLVNDCCCIGAEVAVIEPIRRRDTLSLVREPANGLFTWKVATFSKFDKSTCHRSEAFTSGEISWELLMYPNGYSQEKGKSLSLFLELNDGENFPPNKKVWADYKLRMVDQRHGYNVEKSASSWFTSSNRIFGVGKFISLEDLFDESKGFLVDDNLVIEVEMLTVSTTTTAGATIRSKGDPPPSNYSLKIESFSLLAKTSGDMYESDVFEAGGYKWRLCLYPNGNKKCNAEGYISLYLVIEETTALPDRWEVNAKFKFSVFDQINHRYLTFGDGQTKCFNKMKTEWGFPQLLSLKTFMDASNGYLLNDCCVFGAEVYFLDPIRKSETLSMIKRPSNGSLTWKIKNFSKCEGGELQSEMFTAGGKNWRMLAYPKGTGDEEGKFFSVFLGLADANKLPPKKKVWVECKLRVLNQRHIVNFEKSVGQWFSSSSCDWGYRSFMSLTELHEPSKGFLVGDTVILEVEILTMSVAKNSS